MISTLTATDTAPDHDAPICEARLWQDKGWTARVIKNEDDDGWAVAMFKAGQAEAALIGPWTMGRDKKTPKPLDRSAFSTLVKTAAEVVRRHEQHLHALHHRQLWVSTAQGRITVTLDIVPDEDQPYATLAAHDEAGELLGTVQVPPHFKLSEASASAWIEADYRKPAGRG